ncbi:MAG: substrate-binding domain-containing protein [Parvibaculum sp.]
MEIHGSTTVNGNVFAPHGAAIEKEAGVTLKLVANGSGRGVTDLADGKADVGMVSSPLADVVAKLNKKTPGAVDATGWKAHQIGTTKVAFVVNPGNPVGELTLEQVGQILSGAITDWKDVGGTPGPIVVIAESSGGGIRTVVEDDLLSKKSIAAPKMKEVPNASQVSKIVAQLPTAFGVSTPATATDAVKTVRTDKPIEQPLILVTKGDPSPEVAKIIAAATRVAPQ